MSWATLTLRDGTRWAADWEAMQRLYRWYCASSMQNADKYRRVVRVSDPLGPTVETVEVDWPRLQADAFTQGVNLYANACARLHAGRATDALALCDELRAIQVAAAAQAQKFRSTMRDVGQGNLERIQASNDNWQLAIEVSRVVRDASFGTLATVGGAVVVTGATAAAAAALALGAAGTGYAKYQDTYNPAAALVAGTGALMFSLVPLKVKGAEKAALVLIKAQWDLMQGLIEGKTFGEAALLAGGKVALDQGVGALLKTDRIKDLLGRLPVPVSASFEQGQIAETLVKQAATKTGQPLLKAGVKQVLAHDAPPLAHAAILAAEGAPMRPLRRLKH